MWPVAPARVSQKFANPGKYASRADSHGAAGHHTGIDFGSAWPTPINDRLVRSITDGEVMFSEFNDTMGNWVGIYDSKNNLLVTYWHLKTRALKKGQKVLAYTPVGRVGSTGNSSAPHLHLQVNKGLAFSYSGHINPSVAMKIWSRSTARARYLKAVKG